MFNRDLFHAVTGIFVLFSMMFPLLHTSPVLAQQLQPIEGNFEGGIGFMVAFPQGEFKANLTSSTGFGLGVNGSYIFRPFPAAIGLEGAYLIYGNKTRNVPWSTTIPDVFLDVTTTNNIAQFHLFLRLEPPSGPIRPYVDGLVGFNYFWTETSVKSEQENQAQIASSTNQQDWSFSYGGGAGLKIKVYEKVKDDGKLVELLIDLRVRYLLGGKAEYLKDNTPMRIENGRAIYDTDKSTTDLLSGQVGVSVVF